MASDQSNLDGSRRAREHRRRHANIKSGICVGSEYIQLNTLISKISIQSQHEGSPECIVHNESTSPVCVRIHSYGANRAIISQACRIKCSRSQLPHTACTAPKFEKSTCLSGRASYYMSGLMMIVKHFIYLCYTTANFGFLEQHRFIASWS